MRYSRHTVVIIILIFKYMHSLIVSILFIQRQRKYSTRKDLNPLIVIIRDFPPTAVSIYG